MKPSRRQRKGRFIVIEGLDGAGTTTQAERLGEWLRGQGRRVHVTAEPTSGPIGSIIRLALSRRVVASGNRDMHPAAMALLFAADRLDHLASDIEPKLAAGIDVVTDRYVLSSLAYQGLLCDLQWVAEINRLAFAPDLTLWLKVSPSVSFKRRKAASVDREIYETARFQRQVAESYVRSLHLVGDEQRIVVVDGESGANRVQANVLKAVKRLL